MKVRKSIPPGNDARRRIQELAEKIREHDYKSLRPLGTDDLRREI